MTMTGNDTRIRFWDDRSGRKETGKLDGNVVGIETMFVFKNSSVSLSSLELDCGVEGVGTARVLGSNVVVSLCSIHSNLECSPFVVCWMGETDWNSITVTSSSHVSSHSPSLLPLVSICDDSIGSGRTVSHEQFYRHDQADGTDGWTPSVSITGSSIEFCDGDLILGTGPLIGSLDRAGNEENMKSVLTSLVGCVLVNMTSPYEEDGSTVGSWFGQSIIGSVVSLCSNHLYGTSIRSLNGGGSLLSLNSSFVSCLLDATNENKPFTTSTNLTAEHSQYSFQLCTFRECSASEGGAIYTRDQAVDVQIESCSFDSCSAGSIAGAVYIWYRTGQMNSLTLKSSIFASCSADAAGSMRVSSIRGSTLSECVFLDSKGTRYGGALDFYKWDSATTSIISNCLFQNCKQTGTTSQFGGGAIDLTMNKTVQLTSLLFKDCSAATGDGHAIYTSEHLPDLSSSTVLYCASSSQYTINLVFINHGWYDWSHLLNKSPSELALTALTAVKEGSTADVGVTLDKEVSGTLLVVVSNVGGDREEVTDGIPNIGRVLEFSIPSSSSIGSCSVSISETGLLQTPLSDYSIVSAFYSEHIVSFTNAPIFRRPKGSPILITASCSLDASHTKATVHFEGTDIEEGNYTVTFQDGSSLVVEFTTDSDGKSTGSTDLGVIGSDSSWFERGTWIVKEVKSVTDSKMVIDIAHPLSFTIPTVARLSGIEVSELDGSTKGKVTLSFSCVELEKGVEYTLTLIGQDADGEELTRKITTSASGTIEEKEEVLYPFETDEEKRKQQMKFGVLYKVTSFRATGRSNSVQVGSVVIQMPVEPVRLTNIEKTDETETSMKLLLTGSGFVPQETYTVEVSGVVTGSGSSNAHTRTFTVVASDATSASSSTLVLSSSDATSLQFGQTYSVKKIDNGTNPGIVVGTPSFSTPELPPLPAPTPRLISAVCSLDDSHTKGLVRFEGTDFTVGQNKVTLQDESPLDVLFSKSSEGKWIGSTDLGVIGSDSSWFERGTWIVKEVKSVTDSKMVIDIAHPLSFTIPTVARLSGIEVSELDGSTKGKVTLSFSCVELEKGVEYTLTLIGQDADGEELTRKITTSASGTIEEKEEVLYPFETDEEKRKQQMKFGVLYKVTSFRATGRSNSVQVGSVVIQMPVEPVRLTNIEKTDETETSMKLLLTGSGFVPQETYTVEVSGVVTGSGSSNAHTRTFTVVASDATSASSSTLVLSSSDATSLQFGQTYSVKKIDNGTNPGIVVGTPSFSTPELQLNPPLTPSTPRIISSSLEMNSRGILLSIVLTGEHLPSDSTFALTLNATITIPVSFSSSTKGKSQIVMLGLDGGLDFGEAYSITDLSNGESEIIADGIQISTPPKPTELTICVCSDDSGDSWMIRSGADVSTCLRIERAWNLASRLSIANTMMRIVKPASLSTPLLVSSLPFKLTSGNLDQSLLSLSQPSSMTNSDGSLLSITNGECGLAHLTITTSSSSSFVFISAQSSTITIQMCSIEGTSSAESNSEGSICGWKTGFLHFVESKANLSAVTLKGLGSGGIVQKGGELTISSGIFSDNGQTNSSFPSARQNIHCEGEGKLTIDSLSKGDGTEEQPSAWIDSDDCTLTGKQTVVSSPLFVPTLNSDTSSTNFEKKTNTIYFTVKGEMLVPCGLDVEVFEWDSSKSVKGGSALLSLHSLATTKWTSAEIVGQVGLKTSLSSLESSLDWRARLVFGDNRTTSNSFLFASASSTGKGNMSQGGVTSILIWIIPVVVCALLALILLIVLIIFVTRRNKKKQNEQSLMMKEERSAMEMGEVIVKEEEDVPDSTMNGMINGEGSILNSTRQPIHCKADNENRTISDDTFHPLETAVRDIPESMQREAIQCVHPFETKVVSCADSLYCRLHGRENERKAVSWKRVASSVANGLVQLHLRNPAHHALSALNPHRIVFDNETISIVLNHPTQTAPLSINHNRQPHSLHPSVSLKSGPNEGERWEAPEVKRDEQPKNEYDQAKASVFSLGLVMFEMVTMTVPFGEVDGVNAHRQIVSGSLPDLSKIEDDSTRDLISSCLSFNPNERPSLSSLSDSLSELVLTDPSTAALPSHNVVQ
ncbi:hypothetical protein BLNAU_10661 [Blattamonas nauphoetae]|uniref:Protein kinase domain-containing protein n=1 Tax=Blattamonas nauphoetae TaxID=2049346 RepID=A0ABQ9XRJ7_9EUKA|nr:hypothetical protein BLNAU_10661 [Blattamonas nauphoetae]